MSKFNILLYGEPARVADLVGKENMDNGELRAALENALRRIADLEKYVEEIVNRAATNTGGSQS